MHIGLDVKIMHILHDSSLVPQEKEIKILDTSIFRCFVYTLAALTLWRANLYLGKKHLIIKYVNVRTFKSFIIITYCFESVPYSASTEKLARPLTVSLQNMHISVPGCTLFKYL